MAMSLRSQLDELLPTLLPDNAAQAIKGTELIRLVRLQLGEEYSDASLRYHFSFMAAEPNSVIAKVERGQGYYKRTNDKPKSIPPRGLLPLFLGEDDSEYSTLRSKALALVVRQYDTSGRGVFVFSTGEQGNAWAQPDIAVIDWPEGDWEESTLIFDPSALERKRMLGAPLINIQSVCVVCMPGEDQLRKEFFRALSSAHWSQSGELIIVGEIPDDASCSELRKLSAQFGIGIICIAISESDLVNLPPAEEIFKADDAQCEAILSCADQIRLATGRPTPISNEMVDILGGEFVPLFDWLTACLERGSVENYEFRVSCY